MEFKATFSTKFFSEEGCDHVVPGRTTLSIEASSAEQARQIAKGMEGQEFAYREIYDEVLLLERE